MVKNVYSESGEVIKMMKSFKIESKLEPFYTGGAILLSPNENFLFCQCDNFVKVVEISTGQAIRTFGNEEDSAITICGDNELLFTAHRASLLIKQWQWNKEEPDALVRSFKAHPVPVTAMAMDTSSSLLASGATNSVIRVWDIANYYCTHQFKGSKGVVTLLKFHPKKMQLFSSADDLLIKMWDLETSSLIRDLKGHVSPVTSILFTSEQTMISSGRDKVLNTWLLEEGKLKETFPVFEVLEGITACDGKVVTAGDKGVLRAWNMETKQCVIQQPKPILKREFVSILPYKSGVLCVTFDQNIVIYNKELKPEKNLIGYNDEIIDIKEASDKHIVLATNSEQIRIVNTDTLATEVLSGHSNTVLSIDTNLEHSLLASSSKDNTVMIWSKNEDHVYSHTTTCTGHTSAVSGVAWSHLPENLFLISVGSDLTMKLWQPSKGKVDKLHKTKCVYTVKAHDKDINCVTVSPNDKFVVTGSLDKTAKVWSAEKGNMLGILRGHKRGIWAARFSPIDQCVLTSSGDALVKLWRLSDYSCIRTYEGHSSSVLNCLFISHGRQIASCCADGLIKIWNTQTSECTTTLDGHTDKCWALYAKDDKIVSGAADSLLCFWRDVTEEEELQEIEEEKIQTEQHQELRNLLFHGHYAAAFKLSLTLNMPFKCLGVAEKMLTQDDGTSQMRTLMENLQPDEIATFLEYLASWNTNSKHTITAQTALFALLSSRQCATLSDNPKLKAHWEALIPYTERHFERLSKLQQQATFLQYTWDRMKLSEV